MDPQPETPPTTTTPADPVATPTPAPAAASAKTFTEEQVNEIVQTRLAKDRAVRAKPAETPPALPRADRPSEPDLKAEMAEMRLRNAFDKRIAKYGDVSDATAERLFKLCKVESPEDIGAWVEETAKEFGLVKPTPSQPAAPAATPVPVDSTKQPAAAPAAPSTHSLPSVGGEIDLFNLSAPQLTALGPSGVRAVLDRLWAIGNQMSGAPARPKPPGTGPQR